jgi:hypothetical protein
LQEGLFVKGAERFTKNNNIKYPIFIKPYSLEINDVAHWAGKFDELRKIK